MGLSSQRTAIMQYFHTNWNESNGKVAYPNKIWKTPAGEPWLAFNIVTYFKERKSIGAQKWVVRRFGAVQIDVYIPENTGIGPGATIVDLVEDLFESTEIVTGAGEVIRFRTPGTANIPPNEQRASNLEDSFHRKMITCPFYVDEIKEA